MSQIAIRKYAPLETSLVDRPLTDFSVAYMLATGAFKAPLVAPFVDVPDKKGSYYVMTKDNWFRVNAKKRAPGTKAAGGDYPLTTATYECESWALAKDTPVEVYQDPRAQAVKLQESDAMFASQGVMLALESEVTSALASLTWGTIYTGAAAASSTEVKYWDQPGSTPVVDGLTMKQKIKEKTGKDANVIAISPAVKLALQGNSDVVARQPGAQRVVIDNAMLAALWEVEKVITLDIPYNSSDEGAATQTMATLFGNHFWCGYVAPAPQINTATAIMTPVWSGAPGSVRGVSTRIIDRPEEHSRLVECEMYFDVVAPALDCGARITSVLTP